MPRPAPFAAGAPSSAPVLEARSASIGPAEAPIFVAGTRRRARAVTAAVGTLAVSMTLWLGALIGGAADFVDLPALRLPVAGPAPARQRAVGLHAPAGVQAPVIRATVTLHRTRARPRRALRS